MSVGEKKSERQSEQDVDSFVSVPGGGTAEEAEAEAEEEAEETSLAI